MIATLPQSNGVSFSARSCLPITANTLWKIETGFIRTLTWSEDGTIIVLGVWGAGDVIGRSLSNANPFQMECFTKVQASQVAIDSLPDFAQVLRHHLQHSEALILIRGVKRADVMLLKLLAWLGDRFGQTTKKGCLIDLRLTHQDLAELLGMTRVTVTRLLHQLEQQKYIQRLPLQQIVLQQDHLWHYEI